MKYDITPVAKPRMTQRDKWKKRPVVERYNSFKDQVVLHKIKLNPDRVNIIFGVPMPKSWNKKRKLNMVGKPHRQTPDIDNYLKALFDAVFPDGDEHIWYIKAMKVWAKDGFIEIN